MPEIQGFQIKFSFLQNEIIAITPYTPNCKNSTTESSTSVNLQNAARKQFYVAQVQVGASHQVMNVCLDTGSSDTWFRGPKCRSTDGSCNSTFLDPSPDSTIVKSGSASFSKHYGSGHVGAFIYNASVSMSFINAPHLPIGIAVSLDGFNDGIESGLMGLSNGLGQIWAALGGLVNTNFLHNAGVSLFSFYLANDRDGDKGELTVHGFDSSKVRGGVWYFPVIEPHSTWNIDVSGFTFRVDESRFGMVDTNKKAFPDTGCTLMLLEDAVADRLNMFVKAQKYDSKSNSYPISCSVVGLPEVQVEAGDAVFTIPPSIYVMGGDGSCYSGFSRGAGHAGMGAVLGDTFLRAVVSIYDTDAQRVGFAQAIHPIPK